MNGVGKLLGTTAVIGVGFAAIAVDKIVKEQGPEKIIKPASAAYEAAYERVAPFATFATGQVAFLVDRLGQSLGAESLSSGSGADPIGSTRPVSRPASAVSETPHAEIPAQSSSIETEVGVKPEDADGADPTYFAQCDPSSGASDAAVLGDRVSLRFFEVSSTYGPGGTGRIDTREHCLRAPRPGRYLRSRRQRSRFASRNWPCRCHWARPRLHRRHSAYRRAR